MSLKIPEVKFDAETHTYKYRDFAYPSVTTIINDVMGYQYSDMYYANRGTRIHTAISDIIQNKIPLAEDDITEFLASFNKLGNANCKTIALETPLINTEHGYCGAPDYIFETPEGIVLRDWKSGSAKESHCVQIISYKKMAEICYNIHIAKTELVYLSSRGYAPRIVSVTNEERYFKLFIDMLNIYNFKKGEALWKK